MHLQLTEKETGARYLIPASQINANEYMHNGEKQTCVWIPSEYADAPANYFETRETLDQIMEMLSEFVRGTGRAAVVKWADDNKTAPPPRPAPSQPIRKA